MVRFLALRIRERLPQQVEMEDLISAGIVGLMDAMQKFDPKRRCSSAPMRSFACAAPCWTVCARWTGGRAICAGKHAQSKRRFGP